MRSYKIQAPTTIEEVPELHRMFMIAKNMTTDLRADLSEYKAKDIRYSDPFSDPDFYEADSDFWHVPLFSVGNVDDNDVFARVSVQHTDSSTLYVSFRPMNLDGLPKLIEGKMLESTAKFTGLMHLQLRQTKTVDNLIHITRIIDDVATRNGISAALHDVLMHARYPITIENWFSTLSKKVKSNPFKSHFSKQLPQIFQGAPDNQSPENISIIQALVTFIAYYNPREVVFTGFSYGSSLAMCASILTKKLLEKKDIDISVYQYAGSRVCDQHGREYATQNLKKVVYVALTRNHATLDPVSSLPAKSEGGNLTHVGTAYIIDVARHTILKQNELRLATFPKRKFSMYDIVVGYMYKQPRAEAFKGIHLAGEDVLERLFLAYMIDNNMSTNIMDVTDIPCEYFSSASYPAKYRVCPQKFCTVQSAQTSKGKVHNTCDVKQ